LPLVGSRLARSARRASAAPHAAADLSNVKGKGAEDKKVRPGRVTWPPLMQSQDPEGIPARNRPLLPHDLEKAWIPAYWMCDWPPREPFTYPML
jgi:hypothetical protein